MGNTAGVRRDLHPTPVFGDGKFVGYRVHTMEPTGIGISCGLENGDVVLKVNGLVPSIRMEAELMTAKRVEIEILRGDKPRTLVIEISS